MLELSRVDVDLRGMPEVRKLLASVDDRERVNRERRAVRAAGNAFKPIVSSTAAARHGSGVGNVPASFRRVRVKVSSSNRRGRQPTAIIRPTSPLFNVFEPGASAHTIPAGNGGQLGGPAGGAGWSPEGRKRRAAFHARGAVRHPGMAARPILPDAFSSGVDRAEAAAIAVIFGRPGATLGSVE